MAVSTSFLEFARDTFAPFGEISIRKMFGGAGVYCDGMIFAIVDDDTIFFKVDESTRKAFVARGLSPFGYEMKDGWVEMTGYYAAPGEIFDDADELRSWTKLALDAARRAAKLKPKKKVAAKAPARKSVSGAKKSRPAREVAARRKPAARQAARR